MSRKWSGRSAIAAVLAAAAIVGLEAHSASAQTNLAHLDGSPLDVYADGMGRLQVRLDPQTDATGATTPGEFFGPGSNPGHAGLELVNLPAGGSPELLFPAPVSGPAVTSPSPGTQVISSVYDEDSSSSGTALYRVAETITFRNGTHDVAMHYVIKNLQRSPASFRAGEVADLYTGNSDTGTGVFVASAPRYVGGHAPNGDLAGLSEVTPWSHYQESFYGNIFSNFETTNTDPTNGQPTGLTDTIDPTAVDNGVGAQWNRANVPAGATVPIDVTWLFNATQPSPTTLPPPVFGKTFNLPRWKGLVRYKLPGSNHYIVLKQGVQVPKGTVLDTTKGRVTLASINRRHKQQHAWFYQGAFKLAGQTKGHVPVTLLNLAGPKPRCTAKTSAQASRRHRRHRSRHLWGSGKGHFRTRGQFSSATVRGTIWLTKDTCAGTLVKVKRGVVAVKDFTLHKTFTVKAGHHHLARPPRHHRKHK